MQSTSHWSSEDAISTRNACPSICYNMTMPNPPIPLSAYEFMKRVLEKFPENAIDQILAHSPTGGETEIIELKAAMDLLPEDIKKGDTLNDLYWNYAREAIAMANGAGGIMIIGIKDNGELEPLADHDPRHVIAKKNLEAYLREEVEEKIFPKTGTWCGLKDKSSYSYASDNRVSYQACIGRFKGQPVAVLLIEPQKPGKLLKVIWEANHKRAERLPIRKDGHSGWTELLEFSDEFTRFETKRRTKLTALGEWWAKICPDDPACTVASSGAFAAQPATPSSAQEDPILSRIDNCELRTGFNPGELIDKYKVVRRLGKGGMGVVYEVEHPNLNVHRAVKVFSIEAPQQELLKSRFLIEGRAIAQFNHPGLIRVHDCCSSDRDKCLFYEMDLVLPSADKDALPVTLADRVMKIDDRKAALIFAKLCSALAYLHHRDTYHRDIKLENVLLGPHDEPILSDFGIVRIHDPELKKAVNYDVTFVRNPNTASAGPEVGSKHYLAPELDNSNTPADARSDVYALGVLFFRLLTGEWYQQGIDLKNALRKHSSYWRKVLPQLLAFNPKDRPQDLSIYAPTLKIDYPSFGRKLRRLLIASGIVCPCLIAYMLSHPAALSPLPILQRITQGGAQARITEESSAIADDESEPLQSADNKTGNEPEAETKLPDVKFSPAELKIAERDICLLNNYYLSEKRNVPYRQRQDKDSGANSSVYSAMDGYHAEIFAVWQKVKELTNLGMQIQEVLVSRRDIVNGCAHIRRKAIAQLQSIIDSADYQKALKFYTAVNDEFRDCGLTDIPRPSFTPSSK